MALKGKHEFSVNGLDEFLEKIEKLEKNVDEALRDAIEQAAKPIYDDIIKWAKKHKLTGAQLAQVMEIKSVTVGYECYVELGIKGANEGWHAVFVEYGRPGFQADPGIARAFKKNKSKANEIFREVLAEWSNDE